jgi:tetraacyldisaccharide 4'-kinase
VGGVTVLSVGNLAVGGTGKTPLSAWLVAYLGGRGLTPALVSRGYGRDELLLHQKWRPDTLVVADSDRVAATREAHELGANVVVLDDGFQHRKLERDLDIVLIAAEDAFPGRLLPRGPYRESAAALARASVVVLTRRTASLEEARERERAVRRAAPNVVTCGLCLAPEGWSDLTGTEAELDAGPVFAVAGIARPEAFRTLVTELSGAPVELMAFPDHHEYSARDVDLIRTRAAGRAIAVTEKDAVKLMSYLDRLEAVRVLSLEVRWDWGGEAFIGLVEEALRGASLR